MITIAQILNKSKLPLIETEILLSAIINNDRSYLNAFPESGLTSEQIALFESFEARRRNNEPLAYILGYKEFFGLNFLVNSSVLIPRPETEELVRIALSAIQAKTQPTIIEIGTGSGCIAIAIGKNNPNTNIVATDISPKSLSVARKNALLNSVVNIEFKKADLLSGIDERFDLIISNLPYIPTKNWQKLPRSIRDFEPRIALDSGESGMQLYHKLFRQAKAKLKKNGTIIYEVDGRVNQLSADDLVEMVPE